MDKVCSCCKSKKSLNCFTKDKSKKDGLNSYCRSCCKEKVKRYANSNTYKESLVQSKKNLRDRGKKYLYNYLLDHPCVNCGQNDIRVLEFNHLNPATKKDQVTNLTEYSLEKIQEEIDKCEILCCNCHKIHTNKNSTKEEFLKEKGVTFNLNSPGLFR